MRMRQLISLLAQAVASHYGTIYAKIFMNKKNSSVIYFPVQFSNQPR